MHNRHMLRVLRAWAWTVVYLVVVPVTLLLLMAIVASDRVEPCPECFRLCVSYRDCLLRLAVLYCVVIAPVLVAVAWIIVVAAILTPPLRPVAAYRVAGLAAVLAVVVVFVVVFVVWAIRYPDQLGHLID